MAFQPSLTALLRPLPLWAALLLPPAPARAGTLAHSAITNAFGESIVAVGDCDGDGITEVAISDWAFGEKSGAKLGRVWVLSIPRRRVIAEFSGGEPDARFGIGVASPTTGTGTESRWFAASSVHAPESMLLQRFDIDSAASVWQRVFATGEHRWSVRIESAPDLDADGVHDLLLGSPSAEGAGLVTIVSGSKGRVLDVLHPPKGFTGFGSAVAASTLGAEGNEYRVFVVSEWKDRNRRAIHVLDPRGRSSPQLILGREDQEQFGSTIAVTSPFEGGERLLLAAAPRNGGSHLASDRLEVFSTSTLRRIRSIAMPTPDEDVGHALTLGRIPGCPGLGVIVGSPCANLWSGCVRWTSLAEEVPLRSHCGTGADEKLGFALAWLGDTDGDGAPEVLARKGNVLNRVDGTLVHFSLGDEPTVLATISRTDVQAWPVELRSKPGAR